MNQYIIHRVFFSIWLCAAVLAGGVLFSYHQPFRTLPGLSIAMPGAVPGGWKMIHILAADCGCSQRVMDHLAQRGPMSGIYEGVAIISEKPELPIEPVLRKEGFAVHRFTSESVSNWGLTGVPLLTITSPAGKRVYAGGYGERGDQDQKIFAQIHNGQNPHVLPLLGCAVGLRYRSQTDPFSWKY